MATDDSRPPVIGYPVLYPGGYSNEYPQAHHDAPPPQYIVTVDRSHQTNSSSDLQRSTINYKVLFYIYMICFISCTILYVIWTSLINPDFPEFRIDSVAVTNFSAPDSQHVSGTWRIGIHAFNPSRIMKISYGTIDVSLFYKLEFIADARISPLDQDTLSKTDVNAAICADVAYMPGSTVSGISSDRRRGSVPFGVRIIAWTKRSYVWRWLDYTNLLTVWCDNLPVGLTTSTDGAGKLVGAARECRVETALFN